MNRLHATAGRLEYPESSFVDRLYNRLDMATKIIRSHRIIATALIEEKQQMALADKFKTLAARAANIPKVLEHRADELSARLDTVEKRGNTAFDGHGRVVDGIESGVAAAEDALNQLTNGAPSD